MGIVIVMKPREKVGYELKVRLVFELVSPQNGVWNCPKFYNVRDISHVRN